MPRLALAPTGCALLRVKQSAGCDVSATGQAARGASGLAGQLMSRAAQVHPSGLRHIRADRRINEWRAPGRRSISRSATNGRQARARTRAPPAPPPLTESLRERAERGRPVRAARGAWPWWASIAAGLG